MKRAGKGACRAILPLSYEHGIRLAAESHCHWHIPQEKVYGRASYTPLGLLEFRRVPRLSGVIQLTSPQTELTRRAAAGQTQEPLGGIQGKNCRRAAVIQSTIE